jgi:hypothetical protein
MLTRDAEAAYRRLPRAQRLRLARAAPPELRPYLAALERRMQAVERYMYRPAAWAQDAIDWQGRDGLTAYQGDIMKALAQYRRVAARGPHGLGKTTTASLVVLWFATTRDAAGVDWKVLTTASAWRHLSVYLWPEIHKWARLIRWDVLGRAPFSDLTELLTRNLKLEHGAASPVASNKAELIEGAHADSLLYLVDEAKIVPDATWDAIEGAFSGGRMDGLPESFALAISTPGPTTGRFYDIHRRAPGLEDWYTRHVTLEEAIAAGRITREWADQRKRQWGEDSALYANRVLGEFRAADEDSVIPLGWVEAAIERWHEWDAAGRPPMPGRRVLGVDVARAGGDSTVFAFRLGVVVSKLTAYDRQDTMQTTARVQAALAASGDPGGPEELGEPDQHQKLEQDEEQAAPVGWVPVVDSIGVGGGVVDRLRELGVPVLAYTGAAKTRRRTRDGEFGFANVRSAAYWNLRELLDPAFGAEIMLPPDDLMISDLTTPTWDVITGVPPKVQVEKKEDVVARLGRSPDRGDSIAMAFFAESLAYSNVLAPTNPGRSTTAANRYGRSITSAPRGGR